MTQQRFFMISLTILELLYLVLIFFITVVGTLLTLVLIRVLKVLKVATELADMYNKVKEALVTFALIPDMIKEKVTQTFTKSDTSEEPK